MSVCYIYTLKSNEINRKYSTCEHLKSAKKILFSEYKCKKMCWGLDTTEDKIKASEILVTICTANLSTNNSEFFPCVPYNSLNEQQFLP